MPSSAEPDLFGMVRTTETGCAGIRLPEIEFIHLAAPQNVRFGRSIQHRQRVARCPPGFVCRTGTSYCTRHHLDRIWWEADFQVHILRWNKKDLSTAVSAGVVCEGAADLVKQVPGFHNSPGQSGADIFEHLSHGVVKLWPTDGMNPAT